MEGNIHTMEDLAILIQKTMASKEDVEEVRDGIHTVKENVQTIKEDTKPLTCDLIVLIHS